ncbi:MAG: hypothetical protein CM1200mP41_05050 [Gammaproteobacteria bacterium]|nr:MAG: hypothetical protein CM1200mP41_05050 [Gammaproteobacteria bacterium]
MSLTQEKCLKMYTDMWRIRLFEEEANRQTNWVSGGYASYVLR